MSLVPTTVPCTWLIFVQTQSRHRVRDVINPGSQTWCLWTWTQDENELSEADWCKGQAVCLWEGRRLNHDTKSPFLASRTLKWGWWWRWCYSDCQPKAQPCDANLPLLLDLTPQEMGVYSRCKLPSQQTAWRKGSWLLPSWVSGPSVKRIAGLFKAFVVSCSLQLSQTWAPRDFSFLLL